MKKMQKGFTLIELLVVIGILSILAVALLIAINPAEAQRKARDTQRLKDASNIQAALEGYINDNPGVSLSISTNSAANSQSRDCASTGWLGIGVCNYMNRLPIDPRNTTTLVALNSVVGGNTAEGAYYYVRSANGGYHICMRMESKSNAQKMLDDGLTTTPYNDYFDVYSDSGVPCP